MIQILVTGGLGYIGSHTVVELINAGYEPIVIDNLSESPIEVKTHIEKIVGREIIFRQVEMCDKAALDAVLTEFPKIVGSIHFAAFLLVNESVTAPLKYYYNNLLSTMNLLRSMEEHGISNLVFSSSCTVYGTPENPHVDENAPVQPAESPYGNTKKMGEEILRDFTAAGVMNTLSLRYFNPIGAHPTSMIGEFQDGEPHHLVPYITETAIGKRKELKVFGTDYDTRDGSCLRDYIHVIDIAKAHILAVQHLVDSDEHGYDVINLGSGNGSTVLEMIHAFERATNIPIPYHIAPRRAGDVPAVYANIAKAQRVLGWTPEKTLEDMLRDAWNFEQALVKKTTI
ncbi:MAG: UDP-glucose 4-epimerase GalE [Flavobacteriales bacterium]|jgi:UDP-glucose 4-epimerase